MEASEDVVLLVDGNNLAMRCIKALEFSNSKLSDEQGVNTGPLHVFGQSLLRFLTDIRPDRVAVCFDGHQRTLRRLSIHPGYKANRKKKSEEEQTIENDRFSLMRQWLDMMGVYHLEFGDEEADDLIAHHWNVLSRTNASIVILSADHDLHQLVGPRTMVLSPGSGGHEKIWGIAEVKMKYGCSPSRLPYLKALHGDKSDNIDGIPGIGPKRAFDICTDSRWIWDQILDHPKVSDHTDLVKRNLDLISLQTTVVKGVQPIPKYRVVEPGTGLWAAHSAFCDHYGLDRLFHSVETYATDAIAHG